ncbi:MAG: hypothetical protein K6T30_08855 [Alicyclobacillus sp.]|nr:hypothetical protein [Alicyclobacillus sp.]
MHLEFLVEELSAKLALEQLVPKIIGPEHTFKIHDFGNCEGYIQGYPLRFVRRPDFVTRIGFREGHGSNSTASCASRATRKDCEKLRPLPLSHDI